MGTAAEIKDEPTPPRSVRCCSGSPTSRRVFNAVRPMSVRSSRQQSAHQYFQLLQSMEKCVPTTILGKVYINSGDQFTRKPAHPAALHACASFDSRVARCMLSGRAQVGFASRPLSSSSTRGSGKGANTILLRGARMQSESLDRHSPLAKGARCLGDGAHEVCDAVAGSDIYVEYVCMYCL